MMLSRLNFYSNKNVFWPLIYTIHKINFTGIVDLNVKDRTVKLLEGNMREYLFLKNIYLFIWLCQVLVVAQGIFVALCRIFSCGMWDLVPWPGMEPRPPALGVQSHWTTRGVPREYLLDFSWRRQTFL